MSPRRRLHPALDLLLWSAVVLLVLVVASAIAAGVVEGVTRGAR